MKRNIITLIAVIGLTLLGTTHNAFAQQDKWMIQTGVGYKYVSKPKSHQIDLNFSAGRTFLSDLIEVGVIYNESFNPFQLVAGPILLMFEVVLPYAPDGEIKFLQFNRYIGGYAGLNFMKLTGSDKDYRLTLSPTLGESTTSLLISQRENLVLKDIKDIRDRQFAYGLRLAFDRIVLERMCIGLSSTYLHFNGSNSISLDATITLRL